MKALILAAAVLLAACSPEPDMTLGIEPSDMPL